MFKTENDDIIINDAMRWMVKENSMEETKIVSYPEQKEGMYRLMHKQMEGLLEAESHWLAALSNAAALLKNALQDVNWAGFYVMNQGSLLLGPFQGNMACIRIQLGNGVCGSAANSDETLVVDNVHEFEGHIPCDCASNSEIVVPIHWNNHVIGVLDIDSPVFNRFDEADKMGLLEFVKILENKIDFDGMIG